MLYNHVYDLFRACPDSFRKCLNLIPIEYRLGGENFIDTYNLLNTSQKWDIEQIQRYQKLELQKVLNHAVKHVPYYSNVDLLYDDPFKNLNLFPIIEKEIVQKNLSQFFADDVPKRDTYYVTTGGTSGNSLGFYLDNSTFAKEWAFVMTAWKRAGYNPGDRLVSFRGVEFKNAEKGIFWQENPIYNTLEMSPFHMSDENLPKYIKIIQKTKPKFIHGYPSAISILARYIETKDIEFPKIQAVLAVSENIYPSQRDIIERTFKCRLFSFYGMSEKVIMAPECEYDTRYHAFPEYGVTELLDGNGDLVGEGERGELVGTGFLNSCMPFIRYRTGDCAILSDQNCKCGRHHLLLESLVGRWLQEMIVGKDGALISMTALNFHSGTLKNVEQYQFYQRRQGEIILRIVPRCYYTQKDRYNLINEIKNKVGNNLEVSIELVTAINLTSRGKFKLLIQELTTDRYDE